MKFPSSKNFQNAENTLTQNRKKRFYEVAKNRTENLQIVLDRIDNSHNISAVLRSADAFGISKIHLIGGTREYSKGVSTGAEKWLKIIEHETAEALISKLNKGDYKIVIMQAPAAKSNSRLLPSLPITNLPFEEKLALVFGNEKKGVRVAIQNAATMACHVPMYGFVESLNISVAAAISMFCSTIAATKPNKRPTSINEEEQVKLKRDWIKGPVPLKPEQ